MVFASLEDLSARIDDPDLDVTPDDVLVLQNAGPRSGSGMPEAGYLPIPGKLARRGTKDMIRISDARMSGTAFGTIVLHVTPEAALGGPLGLVRSGDRIRLGVSRAAPRSAGRRGRARAPPGGGAAGSDQARARLPAALPRPRAGRGRGLRFRLSPSLKRGPDGAEDRGLRADRRHPHGRPGRPRRLDRLAVRAAVRLRRLLRRPARRRRQRPLAAGAGGRDPGRPGAAIATTP